MVSLTYLLFSLSHNKNNNNSVRELTPRGVDTIASVLSHSGRKFHRPCRGGQVEMIDGKDLKT